MRTKTGWRHLSGLSLGKLERFSGFTVSDSTLGRDFCKASSLEVRFSSQRVEIQLAMDLQVRPGAPVVPGIPQRHQKTPGTRHS